MKKLKIILKRLIKILFFLFPLFICGQSLSSLDFKEIERTIQTDMEESGAPGAMIRVAKEGEILFEKPLGFRNAKTKEPVTSNTLFLTASVTKTITTTALLILCDRKGISTQTKIGSLLTGLSEDLEDLTLHQILSQSSGILDHLPTQKKFKNDPYVYFSRFGKRLVCPEIQGVFSYTNFGHVLAGMIIAELNDSSFEEAIQELIFRPLHMDRSTYSVEGDQWMDHSKAHKNGKVVDHAFASPLLRASASMFSTAGDLSNFAECFMNQGKLNGTQIIPTKVIEEMVGHYTLVGVLHKYFGYPSSFYGYGMMSFEHLGISFNGHPGETSTQNLLFAMAPDQKTSIIIMSNAGLFPFIRTFETLAEKFLTNPDELKAESDETNSETSEIKPEQTLTEMTGSYYVPEISGSKENVLEVYNRGKQLYLKLSETESFKLQPIVPDLFSYDLPDSNIPVEVRFYRDDSGKIEFLNHHWKTAIKQ